MLEPAIENHVRLAVQEELRGLQEALNSEMRGAFARITKASTTSGGGDSYQPGGLGRTNLHAKSSRSFDAGAASGKSHLYQRRNTVTGVATDSVFDAWRGMSASIPPPPPASGGGVVATVSSEALNSVQDAADEQGVQAQESEPRSSGGESTPDSGDARAMEAEKSGRSTPSMASTSWRVDALDLGDRLAAAASASKGTASIDSIVGVIQAERDQWDSEREGLEQRLEELKELLHDVRRAPDDEVSQLRRRMSELRQTVKLRSRFGTWVCERHMQESDDEEEDEEEEREEDQQARQSTSPSEVEDLRQHLKLVREELLQARQEMEQKSTGAC